jgi:hypothetical protein
MKNNIFIISFILILLTLCLPATALNETPVIEQVSMTIYGNADYANGLPLPAGTVIIAKDQFGSKLGSYTVRETGKIGREYGGTSDNFIIKVWKNQSDKANRTLPIFISFYINNISTKDSVAFQQNNNLQFDITATYLQPEITQTTQIIVPRTIPPANLIVAPTSPKTIITTNTIAPVTIVQQPLIPELSSNDYIYYGILATLVIIIALIIITIAYSYLSDKIEKDDIMGPDGKWIKK